MKRSFTRVVAIGALATALSGGVMSSSQALTLPVTPVQGIAGASPTEHVQWRGYSWGRGYGWGGYGWRRPNYGGAIAAGAIAGGLLGLATAATTSSYYGYGYGSGYGYPSYSYSYDPSYYSYGSSYGYSPSYYGSSYWLSGGRAHKRKHARHVR